MNVSSWLSQAKTKIDSLDAELILAFVLGVDRVFLISHDDFVLDASIIECADDLVQRRAEHYPLAYLTHSKEFYGREFYVDENVLVPRPETENIIDLARELEPREIWDIGTGSGCIAITLKAEMPATKVCAVDISTPALDIVRRNCASLGVSLDYLEQSDLLSNCDVSRADLIIANLPYVDPDWDFLSPELKNEPSLALFAEDNGLALIKKLITQLIEKNYHGYLLLESDTSQHDAIRNYAESHGARFIKNSGFIQEYSL